MHIFYHQYLLIVIEEEDSSSSGDKKRDEQKTKSPERRNWKVSLYYAFLIGSVLIALLLAYYEAANPSNLIGSFVDLVLPESTYTNITSINNATTVSFDYEHIKPPAIPRFIIIWGYIGAAVYTLKVSVKKSVEDGFGPKYMIEHIVRLLIGTVIAVVLFFILITGGFFGLTIDIDKLAERPVLIPYVYAAVAFLAGYSVRGVTETISKIFESVFVYANVNERGQK